MIVNRTVVKHKIEQYEFDLVCDPNAPCSLILEALKYYKGAIQDIIDEAARQNEKVDEVKESESGSQAS